GGEQIALSGARPRDALDADLPQGAEQALAFGVVERLAPEDLDPPGAGACGRRKGGGTLRGGDHRPKIAVPGAMSRPRPRDRLSAGDPALAEPTRPRSDTTASGMAFERPIREIEAQLAELEEISQRTNLDLSSEIAGLRARLAEEIQRTYAHLTAWER